MSRILFTLNGLRFEKAGGLFVLPDWSSGDTGDMEVQAFNASSGEKEDDYGE
jgi:hypothetical protein